MAFDFDRIKSVEFGVCLEDEGGESYSVVPSENEVQDALKEMLTDTIASLAAEGTQIEEFSPSEKYGATERLRVSLDSDLAEKHREIYASENLATNTHGLDDPSELVSYFAIFRDRAHHKLMAFRRAAQFKGVVKKHLITLVNDALCMAPDKIFKLDTDFDFVIYDDQILIWRPSGFIFTAEMDEKLAACAAANVDKIAEDVTCVDFTGLKDFVSSHKLAMRLVAAIKSRNDLVSISKKCLKKECEDAGVKVSLKNGKLVPEDGSEMAFLMLMDRRRYTVTLIADKPETYEAPSRHAAQRAE